jgi:hypothetical protein
VTDQRYRDDRGGGPWLRRAGRGGVPAAISAARA